MTSFASALKSIFSTLDNHIDERWGAGNLGHGFWRIGSIPKLVPLDTLREYGFWQGVSELEKGMVGQVSVALIGGIPALAFFCPTNCWMAHPGENR